MVTNISTQEDTLQKDMGEMNKLTNILLGKKHNNEYRPGPHVTILREIADKMMFERKERERRETELRAQLQGQNKRR